MATQTVSTRMGRPLGHFVGSNDMIPRGPFNHFPNGKGSPMTNLSPKEQARAMVEARIQILVDEAMATSAIEGIHLDPKAVRQAVLRRLAASFEQGGDRGQNG